MIDTPTQVRVSLSLCGLLQGIGFRPFVYQLANEIGLKGWVQNSPQGVSIEAEGDRQAVQGFLSRLKDESPPNAVFHNMESSYLDPLGYENFEIKTSIGTGNQSTLVLPDIATCSDCLQELFDPSNRRYLHPFINCTQCGPRFSLIESLPYDRPNNSMKNFKMCEACEVEYKNPNDRRFHSQLNACRECGPQLEFLDFSCLSRMDVALDQAVSVLKEGSLLAVKGASGFHLMVNASDGPSVQRLRVRKNREAKPFALMFPDISSVKALCELSSLEEKLLLSPQAPIVLLKRRQKADDVISSAVAPFNPYLGVMLPSNPLHHILMGRLGAPVVATSGNVSDETICIDEDEAFSRLEGIADFFLVHNRPIVRHADDSIVRVVMGTEQVLRRARGYAPLPIILKEKIPAFVGAGGYLKNSIAMSKGHHIFISQYIGDLGNAQTRSTYENTIESFMNLCDIQPQQVACDFHPDFASTQWAERKFAAAIPVQHHIAHVYSCMAEHDLEGPLLGVAWDGSGYGLDGTVWGGEFFHITAETIHRVACWRPFPLPGGVAAVNEPRRSALGLLYQVYGESIFDQPELLESFSSKETAVLKTMLGKKLNCPMTSSAGRIFDAVASMTGMRHVNSFESQAAMELEFSTLDNPSDASYPVELIEGNFVKPHASRADNIPEYYNLQLKYQLDEGPMVQQILNDIGQQRDLNLVAVKFQNTLAESIVTVAKRVGEERVVLSGGCFQNKYLTERTVRRLSQEGFQPCWHQKIPPNDGGLALGQVFAATRFVKRKELSGVPCGSW